jgi:hypothetical protein
LAFLHGELGEKIFVEQPPACEKKGHEQKKIQIKKILYGLEQASQA